MRFDQKVLSFNIISAALLSLSFLIYFLKAKIFLDPDFGWSLSLGEFILKNGIPKTDPFSYTMPSYPFVDHEWLTHVIIAKLYSLSGYVLLACIFSLLVMTVIFICIRRTDIKFIPLQIVFLLAALYPYFGIRSQVISWIFLALLSTIILDESKWNKYKYFVPILFLFWANMHGGFMVGVILLIVVFLFKGNFKDRIIILASVLITLINPYGLRLWKEVWISTSDFPLRFYIIEWRPIIFGVSSATLLFLAFSLAFVIQYRKKYKKLEIVLYFLFLLAAFSSVRNIPFLVILAVIVMNRGISQFILKLGNNKRKLLRFYLFLIFLFVLTSTLAFYQMRLDYLVAKTSSEDSYYPRQAVNFLSENLPTGQIFSSYDWGGYLIWKLPQKKVFIDGRMPSWQQKPTKLESGYALVEQNDLMKLKLPLRKVFAKYRIDTVLLPYVWLNNKKDKTTWEIATKFVNELEKNNFRKIYQDRVALIYRTIERYRK